jgi:hypothetical protein
MCERLAVRDYLAVSAFTFISSSVLSQSSLLPDETTGLHPTLLSVAITRLGSPKSFHSTPVAGRTDNSDEQPARIASEKLCDGMPA